MRRRVALLGAGDLGRTLLAHVDATPDLEVIGYLDDTQVGRDVVGRPVLGKLADAAEMHASGAFDAAVIAIGYRHLRFRQSLFERLKQDGVPLATVVHPSCYVDPTAVVGEGAVLFPRCTLDARVEVGPSCVLNIGCAVAHDSRLGGHSFLGPGVTIAGFVDVGQRSFLGVGTVVTDSVRLGEECQTGAGTVVTKDLPSGVLAVGVPARVLRARSE